MRMLLLNTSDKMYLVSGNSIVHDSDMDLETDTIHTTVVYSLANYHCNGNTATAVNTGIKLFDGSFPEGFRIVLDYSIPSSVESIVANATIMTCMNESGSPWPGFNLRYAGGSSSPDKTRVTSEITQGIISAGDTNTILRSGTNHFEIEYRPNGTSKIVSNEITVTGTGAVSAFSWPLVVGGSLSSYNASSNTGNWQRLTVVDIISLNVYKLN